MNMTHDEMKSLIAPYVLGAVSPEETEQVRAHIVSCDECMAEADNYASVVSSLALSVEPEPVPAGLVDGVMSKVHREAAHDAPRPLRAAVAETSDDKVSRLPRRRPTYGLVAAAAAVLVIVAVLAGALITTTNELNDARDDLALERDRITRLVESEGAMRLGSPGGDTIGAMIPTEEGGVFVVHGLEDAPEDHTYQVWLIDDDRPISAGTFDPSAGTGALQTDHSLDGIEGVAVTVEPTGGSRAPTGLQVLRT
ncbi:MAG: anti-sigma factor domain-containing protein [Actinomycetota bacterium]